MTEKELHRLRRQDLLQLLLAQGKETAALQARMEETCEELNNVQTNNERLKEKLNEKDALIEKLKQRLDEKDAKIRELRIDMQVWRSNRRIELEEAGSIAVAALKLNDVFDAAQRAADQYLYNIKQKYQEQGECSLGEPDAQGVKTDDTEGCA